MSLTRAALCVTTVLALSACDRTPATPATDTATPAAAEPPAQPQPQAQAQNRLVVAGEGLKILDATGAERVLPYETPKATVIAAVTAALGVPPVESTNEECGAGPTQFAQYPNGLQLLFQADTFQGWTLDKPGLATENLVGVGVGRAALSSTSDFAMEPDSTLGAEFTLGGIGGFFASDAPDAPVESLYAGLTCFFR